MLTPQEVSTHAFPKARMGGYNMAMVDEFLDRLTEDYTTLYKENAALKAKLKVLVDKVEEYRATEDSMRATLLTAQKMASQMVQEAEQEKTAILEAAETEAGARKAELEAELAAINEQLRTTREESAAFIANMRRLCSTELEFLDSVGNIPVNTAPQQTTATAIEDTVQSIESSVMSNFQENDAQNDSAAPQQQTAAVPQQEAATTPAQSPAQPQAQDVPPATSAAAQPTSAPAETVDEPTVDLDATRRIDFGDLKFGRNYKRD